MCSPSMMIMRKIIHVRCRPTSDVQLIHLIKSPTNEVDKWLAANPDKYYCATGKCSALLTKASNSTVASECQEDISDKKMIIPTVTCWNSFHYAYASIIEMPLADINNFCTKLKEHCLIMKLFTLLQVSTLALVKLFNGH